jgi:hypothetical protein
MSGERDYQSGRFEREMVEKHLQSLADVGESIAAVRTVVSSLRTDIKATIFEIQIDTRLEQIQAAEPTLPLGVARGFAAMWAINETGVER